MREVRLLHQVTAIVIGIILALGVLIQMEARGITRTEVIPEQTDIKTLFAETLELPSLIRVAVDRNPKVKAAKARWQATIEQYPQVTALPDPMFMYGYFLRSVETRVGTSKPSC